VFRGTERVYDAAPMQRSSRAVESIDRALRLLDLLAEYGSGATLGELAATTGLPKSSLHRTLGALQERGFVAQRDDGRYLVGSELLRIAFDFHDRLDLRMVLRPTLERLRATFNETVHVGVLDGADVVYVDKLEPSRQLALTSKVGGRNPAYATAVGKAVLAWTYPSLAAIEAWVDRCGPLVRRTPRTIVDAPTLAREMARVRSDGFAKDMEESEPGVRCVGAPVFFGSPVPIAAISISAPKERLPTGRVPEVAAVLLRETSGPLALTPTARAPVDADASR
jgi:IclR family transcriptional regulator, acetate operon repressor